MGGITLDDFTQSVAYREIFGRGRQEGRQEGHQQGLGQSLQQVRGQCTNAAFLLGSELTTASLKKPQGKVQLAFLPAHLAAL